MRSLILLGLTGLLLWAGCLPALAAKCLYVSSYHAGYEWNDDIEQGIEDVLAGQCELRKFYMDGKRHLGDSFARQKASEALDLIQTWHPDIVIAADDNASKYLVMPYLKDGKVPVVFCGINWTADAYGYPYANATGMIEIGPIDELVAEVKTVLPGATKGIFLSAAEITQYKEAAFSGRAFGRYGITISHWPVRSMADWECEYLKAQDTADFLIIGNYAGISDWDPERALAVVTGSPRCFTVTYLEWMAPFSMLGMAKIAAEQGEWAAKTALLILGGAKPSDIPVVANRRWNMYVNPFLLKEAGIELPRDVMRRAKKVGP